MKPNYHPSLTDGTLDQRHEGRQAGAQDADARAPSVRLATLPRHGGDELRVDLDEYQGHRFVSVRVWFQREGQWRPGKGVTVKVRELEAVKQALERAVAIVKGTAP